MWNEGGPLRGESVEKNGLSVECAGKGDFTGKHYF
jgi:hypothetical protein